jgi:CelD/BcsL family acetyltransferase involved in cellulose biosynthesis
MNGWTIVPLDRTLGEYAGQWDALQAQLFSGNPMLDSRFVDALLQHFGDGSERLCLFHNAGGPQAMCILRPRGAAIWASFLPAQAQVGPALLNRPELVDALLQALPGVTGQVDFLCNDPEFGDLSETDNRRRESRDHALTMCIDLSGGFETYWTNRPKKLIQNIGRYERRRDANNVAMTLERICDSDGLDTAVARYAQLESSGWKGKSGTALNMSEPQGHFYLDLIRRFAQSTGAVIYELWLDGKLAASRMTIATGHNVVMLKTTYDESMSQYSPGRLLLHRVIQDLFDRHPGGFIEFYTDANADLLAWATGQRWVRHVSFYRNAIASSMFEVMRASRKSLARRFTATSAGREGDSLSKIEEYRHPGEFPEDVRRLFAEAETISIEFGASWYANLVDTVYPKESSIRFYVLRQAGQPVAALPVLLDRAAGGKQTRSLANFYSALYAPAIAATVKAVDLVPLINAIRDLHRPLGSFRFAPMDPESLTYRRLINAMRSAGIVPFQYFCFGNWYLNVDSSWAEYLAGRDGAIRSTIKRMGKKFGADGGTLEIIEGGPDLERGLHAYERVYATSWKVPEPFPAFMPGLIRACAERGWLRLGVAWLKERPIAAQVWIVANNKASIYKLAYDESEKAYAPGTLLTALMMQRAIDQDKVTEIDYLIGDDPYKKNWMSNRRERWGLVGYSPTTLSGLLGLVRQLTSWTLKKVRSRWSATHTRPGHP